MKIFWIQISFDSFIVSVDGPSAIHDILRKRRGSYKSTIQNINKIIKKNIPLTLATTRI